MRSPEDCRAQAAIPRFVPKIHGQVTIPVTHSAILAALCEHLSLPPLSSPSQHSQQSSLLLRSTCRPALTNMLSERRATAYRSTPVQTANGRSKHPTQNFSIRREP